MPLLKDIESLARLHRDGALDDREFEAAKAAMLREVPDADIPEPADDTAGEALPEAVVTLARCLLPPALVGGTVLLLGIPPMLSLTLAVTILAATVVAQFRRPER